MGDNTQHKYTPELGAKICALLSMGFSLRSICRSIASEDDVAQARADVGLYDSDLPNEATVRGWAIANVQGFHSQYTRARDMGLDCKADEVLDIARRPLRAEKVKAIRTLVSAGDGQTTHDEVVEVQTGDAVDRARLNVETLKWYLSKLAPKRYGDKIEVEHSGTLSISERLLEARRVTRGD